MLHLRQCDESQIVFSVSIWNRWLGAFTAAVGVILICAGLDLAPMPALPPDWEIGGQFILVSGIALLGTGLGVAFYTHELTFDLAKRTYCLRRGISLCAASSTGGFDEFNFLGLEAEEMPDGWTEEGTEPVWHLYLYWKHSQRRRQLLGRWRHGRGVEARRCLKYLSAKLGLKAVRFGGGPADGIIVRSPLPDEVPAMFDKATARRTFHSGDYIPSRAAFAGTLVLAGAVSIWFGVGWLSGFGGRLCIALGAVVITVGLAVAIQARR